MLFTSKIDLRKTFSLVFFFTLIFGSFSVAHGGKASPFEIEMFSTTNNSARSLRLVTGDLSMEMIPVEMKPGLSLQNSFLVLQKKKLPMEMEYVVDNRSIKENVSLDQYRKIDRITFELKLKNLTYKQANGLIGFYDKHGKRKFYLNRPYMKDMGDVNTDAVNVNMRKEGNHLFVDLVPHDLWLKDRARIYSVRVVLPVGF